MADGARPLDSREWARKYPPLLSMGVALMMALVVMPSALNLPQTNPTQTLEYAPVPPDDDEPPPPRGNLSALGVGASPPVESGGALGGADGVRLPPLPAIGKGVNPSAKRCVGNPPRQTEDALAPPCVSFFQGDNFGSTYQGVAKEEIRLLVYIDSFIAEQGGSRGRELRPESEYFDLFEPPDPRKDEHLLVEGMRGWQRYFNDRFQTYGRTVHFYVFFSSKGKTPGNRRSDAADNFAKVRPFAVLTDAYENEVDYVEAMAKKGVLSFGSFSGKSSSFFQKFPKLIWGYQPTLEYSAGSFGSFLCTKVLHQPVAISGNALENGKPRKIGLWHTEDENWPGLVLLADLVKKRVKDCGGEIDVEATFPVCCYAQDNRTQPDYAASAMADFKQRGITTIVWPGGIESHACKAAQAIGYQPEWVLLGDGTMDTNWPMKLSGNTSCFDDKGVTVSAEVLEPAIEEQRCYQAFREVNTTRPKADMHYICESYRNLFQLFTGIQVAGPRLGPTSIDAGYHAIPAVQSNDATVPACFYRAEDYSCVKDAQVEIWDAQGNAPGDSRPGCWRALETGKRYQTGAWPKGNIDAQRTGKEPCNARSTGVVYRFA